MQINLPVGNSPKALSFSHFPTKYQAVVWRNWELVPVKQIARVLSATEEDIMKLAEEMGLRLPPQVSHYWLERGYITIIRTNWHLLNYDQLLVLLGWNHEKLAYALKEDDFLFEKLGGHKPYVEPVFYCPLNADEKAKTKELKELIASHFSDRTQCSKPFDFLNEFSIKRCADFMEYGKNEENAVAVDSTCSVTYQQNLNNVDKYTERFAAYLVNRWGIKLGEPSDACGKRIILELGGIDDAVSESHVISVDDKVIRINAVDNTGLLRGLQWLEKEMEYAGGPYLRKGRVMRHTRFTLRLVYSYFAVYGDPLIDPNNDPYPDELLDTLSKKGINGIWLQGVLYNLVSWDKAPELSKDYEKRIEGLKRLVERAAVFGIGVYLYLNEPRSMSVDFFKKHPELKGHEGDGIASLCTSHPDVRNYIWNGVRTLFKEVPDLAGVITITMSENLTNCYSRAENALTNCPRCKNRSPQEVISEVNRIIAGAAQSVKPDAKIICWNWGWNRMWGWDSAMVSEAVDMLPDGTSLMCTSEDEMPTCIAGIERYVRDYSMSIVGPSEKSRHCWKMARGKGLNAIAKVQFNNTWECSAVPYLPVINLVQQHIANLVDCGVSGLMLGWTLGGYPSLNLDLASQFYWKENGSDKLDIYDLVSGLYGKNASEKILAAFNCFSRAFKEFPFDLPVLYTAPQNFGPSNLLYLKPTGFKASMIGFPYDDIESWRGIYPEHIFEEQFKKLSIGWKNGIEILNDAEKDVSPNKENAFKDLMNVSEAAYCHFRSAYLQTTFTRLRNQLPEAGPDSDKKDITSRIIAVLDEEIYLAKTLHEIVRKDSRIGYEASNHYFYTSQHLKEKVLNCEGLKKQLQIADSTSCYNRFCSC